MNWEDEGATRRRAPRNDDRHKPKAVLIIEHGEELANGIRSYLEANGWQVNVCHGVEPALSLIKTDQPDIVVIDDLSPGKGRFDYIKMLITAVPKARVVIITALNDVKLAVEAMKVGAYDYLSKPVVMSELYAVLQKALARDDAESGLLSGARRHTADRPELDTIIGEAPAIAALKARLNRLLEAEQGIHDGEPPTVLITGETGTGKGLVARALHFDGLRREGPFVEVNCASIPVNLLEAELFGYERGAFTDAKERKEGLVEAAEGGTLFLDEIGEVDFSIQAKLLKLLEERTVRRVGAVREKKVNVRIISATNQDMDRMVREGRFRADLYFRLRIISLHMPPLRERDQDALLLARVFLQDLRHRYGRPELEFAAATDRALLAYHWPGNARELRNSVEQAVLLTPGSVILPENIALCSPPRQIFGAVQSDGHDPDRRGNDQPTSVDRDRINAAIEETNWNIARAARLLGISRSALRYRIRKHGLLMGLRPGATSAEDAGG